jgi:hypothetical protein
LELKTPCTIIMAIAGNNYFLKITPVLSIPGTGIQGSGIAAIPQSVIAGGKNPRSTIAIRDCG